MSLFIYRSYIRNAIYESGEILQVYAIRSTDFSEILKNKNFALIRATLHLRLHEKYHFTILRSEEQPSQ